MATFVSTKGNLINDKGAVVGKAPAGTTGTFTEGVAPRSAAGSAQSTARATSSSNPHDAPGYNPANDPLSSVNMKGAAPTKPLETPINTATGLPSTNLPPTTPSAATVQPANATTQATPEQVAQVQNASNTIQSLSEEIGSRYKTGLANVQNQGIQPAATLGQANSTIQSNLPSSQNEPNSVWPNVFEMDPNIDKNFVEFDEWFSPPVQKQTLLEQYQEFSKSLGIESINEKLINAERVISGTEQDIRNEIVASGSGVATDSQVQSLAISRNKVLLQNYNTLLSTREAAMTQLSTMMELSMQDRKMAEAEFDRKMDYMFRIQDYKDKFVRNSQENYNNIIAQMGYSGLMDATNGDPYYIGLAEKSLGLAPGGLANLAKQDTLKQQAEARLQAKQLGTSKSVSVGGSLEDQIDNLKLSAAQKGDLVEIQTLNDQIRDLESYAADGILEGIGSFGRGTIKELGLKFFGKGSEEGGKVRTTIGNLKGQIAKLRGGTSFTANEEKLLDSYVPGINESTESVLTKIRGLRNFLNSKQNAIIQVGGGIPSNANNDPLGIL